MTRAWILMVVCAGCAGDSVATTVQPAVATNAVATNAVATNAVATNAVATNLLVSSALGTNAYYAASGALTARLTDPTLKHALEDPNARIFMRYLVGCALAPGQAVEWTNHNSTYAETYPGLLGLCPAWQKGAPDATCRERVSACILARNNSFGVSVAFSIRGTYGNGMSPLPLGDRVPAHDHLPRTNRPVPSLAGCYRSDDGALRSCGWRRDFVGICEPGAPVSIAAGNYARCEGDYLGAPGSDNEVLRVCAGISACDHRTAIASVDDACDASAPGVEFTCPADGLYAVMLASYDAHGRPDGSVGSERIGAGTCGQLVCDARSECCTSWTPACDVVAETACRYPASEAQVFRWREGSFYGDMFGSSNLNPAKPQVRVNDVLQVESFMGNDVWVDGGAKSNEFVGVVYRQMYACSSANWKTGPAYIARRVCAGPDPNDPTKYTRNCAAAYAGPCKKQCATLDADPIQRDHDAANCFGGKRVWPTPMTTLLANPLDAVPDPSVSATVSSVPDINW